MDNPFKSPVVLSFCPGILGLERGIERVIGSFSVAAYVEIETFIIANLVAGMEAGVLGLAPVWTDAKTFNALPFRGKVHGIIGGYPCPGESLAGLREGHLYKGFIWPSIRRAIAAAKPLWCFFENVDDHLTGTYPIVQRSLRNMGYAVEAGIYSAEEVGAPHERKRLFILAIMADIPRKRLQEWFKQSNADQFQTIKRSGIELANSNSSPAARRPGNIQKKAAANEGSPQGKYGQRMWDEPSDIYKEMAHTNRSRLTEQRINGKQDEADYVGAISAGTDKWPAGQGTFQYEWEEPRTVKPGVGCTINGYNFREDLLRAIGNSVVEQTAEIAFIDLLNKHLKCQ